MVLVIAGGGKMGMSHLALCTPYVGKANVVLCETNFFVRQLFRYLGYRTYDSLDSAARNINRIDGVIVATPTRSHAELATWALVRRIPVFVEKPLTLSVAESSNLSHLASTLGVPTQVGFVMRWVPSFQRLRGLVQSNALGRVREYSASMRGNVITTPNGQNNWKRDRARGGGCLNEYGPHLIDLCTHIFGDITTIEHAVCKKVYSANADDVTNITWRHQKCSKLDNSIQGQVLLNWSDTSKRKSVIEFNVEFDLGEVRADNSAIEVNWRSGTNAIGSDPVDFTLTAPPENVGFYLRGEEFSLEIEAFLRTCGFSAGMLSGPALSQIASTFNDGLEVDRIIHEVSMKAFK